MENQDIKKLLKDKGLTQDQLAAQAGITQSTVSRHINKENAPKIKELFAYAQVFGMDVTDLAVYFLSE